jgi:hypothetical protein
MTKDEKLRALEAAIEEDNANLDKGTMPSEELDDGQPSNDVDNGEAGGQKADGEGDPEPTSKPWEDIEVPDNIPEEYVDAFREQAWKRADAIVTKNRQKDKKELEEAKKALKAEDVFGNDTPAVELPKAKSYEEILADIPEDSREELKPLLDKVREITDSQTAPLRNMQAQQAAAQRLEIEKAHFNELMNKYEGFPFTQEMINEAKQLQSNYPNYSVAQLMQAKNQDAIFDWKVEQKAKSIIEQYNKEDDEHPGGSPNGKSPARNKTKLNFEGMSRKEKLEFMEKNLPRADR